MSDFKNIHEAIAHVYGEVGYVKKERSKEGGVPYSFAGEAALIKALRQEMVDAGIYMHVVEIHEPVYRETYTTAKGSVMNRTALRMTVRFTHAATETFIDVQAVGEGSDSGDKSTPKAQTGAYKYAIRETFMIETGDDPDKAGSGSQSRSPTPVAAAGVPTRDVDADVPKASPVTRTDPATEKAIASARAGFWATSSDLDLKEPDVYKLYGREKGVPGRGLTEYVVARAKVNRVTVAQVWTAMKNELPAKIAKFNELNATLAGEEQVAE